jgi:uncharacterized membrane protein (DUF485 family)
MQISIAWQGCQLGQGEVNLHLLTMTMQVTSYRMNPEKPDVHGEPFLRRLMRRQLRLSAACAAAFAAGLLLLPLLNYFAPELMAKRVFGFTFTWLLLGMGFFPAVWAIAWFFIRRSMALEEAEVREAMGGEGTGNEGSKQ